MTSPTITEIQKKLAEYPELLQPLPSKDHSSSLSSSTTHLSHEALKFLGLRRSLAETLPTEVLIGAARGYRTQLRIELATLLAALNNDQQTGKSQHSEGVNENLDRESPPPALVRRYQDRLSAVRKTETAKPLVRLNQPSKPVKVFNIPVDTFLDASLKAGDAKGKLTNNNDEGLKPTENEEQLHVDAPNDFDYSLYFPQVPHFYINTHPIISDKDLISDANDRRTLQYVLDFERKTRKVREREDRKNERIAQAESEEQQRIVAEQEEREKFLIEALFCVPFGFQKVFRPMMDHIFAQKTLQRLVIPAFKLYMRRSARKSALKKIISASQVLPVSQHQLRCNSESQFCDYLKNASARITKPLDDEDDANPYAIKKKHYPSELVPYAVISLLARDVKAPLPSQIVTQSSENEPSKCVACCPTLSEEAIDQTFKLTASNIGAPHPYASSKFIVPVEKVPPLAPTQSLFGKWSHPSLAKLMTQMKPHYYFAGEMIFYADEPMNEDSSEDEYDEDDIHAEYESSVAMVKSSNGCFGPSEDMMKSNLQNQQNSSRNRDLITRKARLLLNIGRRTATEYRVATKPLQPPQLAPERENNAAQTLSGTYMSPSDESDSDIATTIATNVRTQQGNNRARNGRTKGRRATVVSSSTNKESSSLTTQPEGSQRHRKRILHPNYTRWAIASCNLDNVVLIAAGDVVEFDPKVLQMHVRGHCRSVVRRAAGGQSLAQEENILSKTTLPPPVPISYHSRGAIIGALQALGGFAFSRSYRCETDVIAYRIPVKKFLKFMTTQPLLNSPVTLQGGAEAPFVTRAQRHAHELALNSFQAYKADSLAAVKVLSKGLFVAKDEKRELRDIGKYLVHKNTMLSGSYSLTLNRQLNEHSFVKRPLAYAIANPDAASALMSSMGLINRIFKDSHPILQFLPDYVINGLREHITRGVARAGEVISNDVFEGSRLFIIRRGTASLVTAKVVPQPFTTLDGTPQLKGRKSIFVEQNENFQAKSDAKGKRVSLFEEEKPFISDSTTKPTSKLAEESTIHPKGAEESNRLSKAKLSFASLQEQQRLNSSNPSAPATGHSSTVVLSEAPISIGKLVGIDSVFAWDMGNIRPPPHLTPQTAIMLGQVTHVANGGLFQEGGAADSGINRYEKRSSHHAPVPPIASSSTHKLGASIWGKLQKVETGSLNVLGPENATNPGSEYIKKALSQGPGASLPTQIASRTAPVKCSVVADTYCEYYAIPKQGFINVLKSYHFLTKVRAMVSLHAKQHAPNSVALFQQGAPSAKSFSAEKSSSGTLNSPPQSPLPIQQATMGGNKLSEGSGASILKQLEPVFNFLGGKTLHSIASSFKIRVTLPGEKIMSSGFSDNISEESKLQGEKGSDDESENRALKNLDVDVYKKPRQKYIHLSTTKEAVILLHGTLEQAFKVTPTLWKQSQQLRSHLNNNSAYSFDEATLLTSATSQANKRSLLRFPWSFFGFSETLTEASHTYDLTSIGSCVIATISRESLLEAVLVASTATNPRQIAKILKLKQLATQHRQNEGNNLDEEYNPERSKAIMSTLADSEESVVFQLLERAELITQTQQLGFARLWVPQNMFFSAAQLQHQQQPGSIAQTSDAPHPLSSDSKTQPTLASLSIEMHAAAATLAMVSINNAQLERLSAQLAAKEQPSTAFSSSANEGFLLSEEQQMLQQARAKCAARAKERQEKSKEEADAKADVARRQDAAKAILLSQKNKRRLTVEGNNNNLATLGGADDINDKALIDDMAQLMMSSPNQNGGNNSFFDLTDATDKKTHRLEAAMRELHYRKIKRDVHIMDVENRALVALSTQLVAASRQDGSKGRLAMEYLRPEYSPKDFKSEAESKWEDVGDLEGDSTPFKSKNLPVVAYYRSANEDDDIQPKKQQPLTVKYVPSPQPPPQRIEPVNDTKFQDKEEETKQHTTEAKPFPPHRIAESIKRTSLPRPPPPTLASLFPSSFGTTTNKSNSETEHDDDTSSSPRTNTVDEINHIRHLQSILNHYSSEGPKTKTKAESDRTFLAQSRSTVEKRNAHLPDVALLKAISNTTHSLGSFPSATSNFASPARSSISQAELSSKRAEEVATTMATLLDGGRARLVQTARSNFAEVTRRNTVSDPMMRPSHPSGGVSRHPEIITRTSSPRTIVEVVDQQPVLDQQIKSHHFPFPPKLTSSQLSQAAPIAPSSLTSLEVSRHSASARSLASTTATLPPHSISGHDQWTQRMLSQQRRLKGYSASASQRSNMSLNSM